MPDKKPMRVSLSALMHSEQKQVPLRRFTAPKLPRGVIPRYKPKPLPGEEPHFALDDASVAPTYAYANQFNSLQYGFGFQGYPYLAQLSQITEYRAPVETMAKEMTRRWIEFRSIGDSDASDKIEQIDQAFRDFKLQHLFAKAAEIDGFFGRAQMFIDIKGQESAVRRAQPLLIDPRTIPKGSLNGFTVIEPQWTSPYSYNADDPTRSDFYQPQSWFVLGRKTHHTRLMTFIARAVPDILKPAYNFGGLSLSQLMEPYVNQWLRTRNSVSDMIHMFSTSGFLTDMQASLEDPTGDGSELFKRIDLFNRTRDNRGAMVLNKDTEEFFQVNTPLSGLHELQAQSQEHMCGPAHVPNVKLWGVTPSGLNASAEDEITVFYDFVRSMQEFVFTPHLNTVLKIVQCHLFGAIDDKIGYEYVPLAEPTGKEIAEIAKSRGDAGVNYINSGVISPEEERQRLASDPNSGYNGIDPDDVPEPPMDPSMAVGPDGEPLPPDDAPPSDKTDAQE